jgi:hypothetical protein
LAETIETICQGVTLDNNYNINGIRITGYQDAIP